MEEKGDSTDWKDCCHVVVYLRKLLIYLDLPIQAQTFVILKKIKQSLLEEENVVHFLEKNSKSQLSCLNL